MRDGERLVTGGDEPRALRVSRHVLRLRSLPRTAMEGAADDHENLVLEAADENRFAAFAA